MPRQAIRSGAVDQVLPLDEIASAIQIGRQASQSVEPTREGSS
jgi:chemotaxis response regulator CheB